MTEETRFANLGRVVRRWADRATDDPADQVAQWVALERSLSRSRATLIPRLGLLRPRLAMLAGGAGAAMVVAAAVLASVTHMRGRMKAEPALTFLVTGGASVVGGTAPSSAEPREQAAGFGGRVQSSDVPARLSFSDGSNVVLQTGARGRVLSTTARGARIRVEQGRARFAVAHLPQADWTVEAGPFVVLVHGTVFDLNWSPDTGSLAVELMAGSITVQAPAGEKTAGGANVGPRVTNGTAFNSVNGLSNVKGVSNVTGVSNVRMTAGQHLMARLTGGQAQLSLSEAPVVARPTRSSAAPGQQTTVDTSPPAPLGRLNGTATGDAVANSDARQTRRSSRGTVQASAAARQGRAGGRPPGELVEVASSWEARVAAGGFQGVVTEAETLGVERCLKQAPLASLAALADAARYMRRPELARRALLAERHRFAGSKASHDAAFLLGRLADDASRDPRQAVQWYDRYLAEARQGTYAAEALGRKMMALDRLRQAQDDADNDAATRDRADARAAAEQYLGSHPDGPFAARARRIRDSD